MSLKNIYKCYVCMPVSMCCIEVTQHYQRLCIDKRMLQRKIILHEYTYLVNSYGSSMIYRKKRKIYEGNYALINKLLKDII